MVNQLHYHTQTIKGELVVGVWDHRPVMHHYEIDAKSKSLLDVGCRDGLFAAHYADFGAKVTAIDLVDRADMRERQKDAGFDFVQMSVYELCRFEQESFDVVFCADVLQHLENPIGALRQMHHVARRDLFLVTDIHEELGSTAKPTPRSDYPFHWGPDFVKGIMANAGWNDISVLSRFQIGGTVYEPRQVAMFHAIRDPNFVL